MISVTGLEYQTPRVGSKRHRRAIQRTAVVIACVLATSGSTSFGAPQLCFDTTGVYGTDVDPHSVVAAHLNNDLFLDLIVANQHGTSVGLLKGVGNGLFEPQASISAPNSAYATTIDFDADGDLDLLIVRSDQNAAEIHENLGAFQFNAWSSISVGGDPRCCVVVDLDGDALEDFACARAGSHDVSIHLNNGDGSFTSSTWDLPYHQRFIRSGDFDHDGDNDLAATLTDDDKVAVLFNDGSGAMESSTTCVYVVGSAPHNIACADVSTDGVLDLITTNLLSNTVSVLLGGSAGLFAEPVSYPTASVPRGLFVGDLNGDDVLDIAAACRPAGEVSLLINLDGKTFQPAVGLGSGPGSMVLTGGDFDRDGSTDLAVADVDADNILVLTNCGSWCPSSAMCFDGTDDEVVIPHHPTLSFGPADSMTVELWFVSDEARTDFHLLGKRPSCAGDGNWQMAVGAGMLFFGSLNSVWTPFAVQPGVWTHVAGTYDGAEFRLYVNGALQSTRTDVMTNENESPLQLGTSADCPSSQRLIGCLDEVRIWNRALTSTEIASNYNVSIGASDPGLMALWTFEESPGTQEVFDSSPVGNHGTLGASLNVAPDDPHRVTRSSPYACCSCPLQADLNDDGFIDSIDLGTEIDIVFFGGTDIQDELCPTSRGDFNNDGATDSVDLSLLIDHVFFGGPGPADPCFAR